MLRQAVHHRPGTSHTFAHTSWDLELRLQTGHHVERVTILHGDKYDWETTTQETAMAPMGSDGLFIYWRAIIHCPQQRVRYCFGLKSQGEVVWYGEEGFFDQRPAGQHGLFDFPWLHQDDSLQIPDWVREAVFYQIFPERFANGNPANDPPDLTPWEQKPEPRSMYGGDLQGIIDKLDYLKDLGITAIYLTPIFQAPSNHKYDTIDYFTIDPHFGDIDTFRRLVKASRKRGIRLVLDAVFNHIGWLSPQFQDVLAKGQDSPYADWFIILEFPVQTHPRPNYSAFAYVASMPKLNTKNPQVREYLFKVAEYWLGEGIDGWRLDVANEVDHQFWREFRRRVKAANPEGFILGEIMHKAEPWLRGDQFDGVMNYPLTYALWDWLAKGGQGEVFVNTLVGLQAGYSRPALEGSLNLIDSHDTARFLTEAGGDIQLQKLAAAVLFTLPGPPSIYYGDEIGMKGGHDPDCRRGMIWAENQWDKDLLAWYKRLIKLRREHPALSRGDLRVVASGPVAWWREEGEEALLIVINGQAQKKPLVSLLGGQQWLDLITGRHFVGTSIGGRDILILKKS